MKIIREAGKHTVVKYRALIPNDKKDSYADMKAEDAVVEIRYKTKEENITLFKGVITEIKVRAARDVYYIEVEAKSMSIKLDIKKKERSYQDITMKYKDLFEKLGTENGGNTWVPDEIKNISLEELIVQYKETDWEFLGRMASKFGKYLTLNDCLDKPHIFVGISNNGARDIESEVAYYRKGKCVKDYLKATIDFEEEIEENDYISYEIETTRICYAGEQYNFKGEKLTVIKSVSELKKGILNQRILLVSDGVMRKLPYSNNEIKGISLKGKVIEVSGDKVKVHLNIDKSQDKAKGYEFKYKTPHWVVSKPL